VSAVHRRFRQSLSASALRLITAVNPTGVFMTHDPKLLSRVAEKYFTGGTKDFLIQLNKRRIRNEKETEDGKES
jgi:hypothetical protein